MILCTGLGREIWVLKAQLPHQPHTELETSTEPNCGVRHSLSPVGPSGNSPRTPPPPVTVMFTWVSFQVEQGTPHKADLSDVPDGVKKPVGVGVGCLDGPVG